jgi:1,4-dihydroxy-2-naphthoyl-CoA hydrolase
MLQLRPNCECCDRDLPPDSELALICSFECTFCQACADGVLAGKCPNCGGELRRRPRRPAAKLAAYPASTQRVLKSGGCAARAQVQNPRATTTLDGFNERGREFLPGLLGIVFSEVQRGRAQSELALRKCHMAPNGFLHAGTVVTLADTSAGYGCFASFPEGATGFTTIELKTNHLGTARDGTIDCVASAAHLGRTTQVWDAVVTHRESGKTIGLFRCTQLLLYTRGPD